MPRSTTPFNPRGRAAGPSAPPLPGWVLALLYAAALVLCQSLLSRLFAIMNWPPPDLFLLTGIALARRWPAVGALLAAYGIGLAQDALGAGSLGLHAAALAGGTLLVLLSRRVSLSTSLGQTVLDVVAAVMGQWLTFMLLTYWLRTGLVTAESLGHTLPLAFLSTLLVAPLWNMLADYALGARQSSLD